MKEFKQFLTRKTRADGVNEKESTILAVAGKGGVGKTSIAAVRFRCTFDAIHLEKVRDLHAGTFETMPIKVAEHVVKRTGAILAKAIKGE